MKYTSDTSDTSDIGSNKTAANAETESAFLTGPELQERWKVSRMFVWRMRHEGRLNCYRIGGRRLRYARAEVEAVEQAAAGVPSDRALPTADERKTLAQRRAARAAQTPEAARTAAAAPGAAAAAV